MNNFDFYVPIDVHSTIRTGSSVNISKGTSQNPVILFQLYDGCRPLMLDDISKVSIAFTNPDNVSVTGSGNLQVVNPHRGTISYEVSNKDLTMPGLLTVTLGITTGTSFFTVQSVVHCQDISDSLMDALNGNSGSGGSGGSGSCDCGNNCSCEPFPCGFYNAYCRMCRRCKWAWENNTYPRPLCFEEMKMCKNPFITPPLVNMAVLPEYEEAGYTANIADNGMITVAINDVDYTCDIGKDGALYVSDKSISTPAEMVGLYLGAKMITYYKKSEKATASTLNIDSLF